jgi:hypothetical protein
MIKVPGWIYRLLWITVAVIGAMAALGGALILLDRDGVTVNSGGPVLIMGAVFGAFMLIYAAWRLLKPLRPPPRE